MKQFTMKFGAKAALFIAAIIWGISFLIVKTSVDVMGPHTLLAFRFTIGCLLLCLIFFKRLKTLNKQYIMMGGFLGSCLFFAYSLQTIGITDTTPGKNAFLTANYCVLVPFIVWIVEKKKPNTYNILAAFIAIIGIGLVSLNEGLSIGMGDSLTLASGIFYAMHMVAVAKFSQDKDPILLTILQFAFAAIYSFIVTILFEELPSVWSHQTIAGIFYLSVFATAIALLLQNIGQKYTNPTSASLILSLESVFSILFSVIFYHEEVTLKLFIGFLLIFTAVFISETKLSFLKSKKENKEQLSKECRTIEQLE